MPKQPIKIYIYQKCSTCQNALRFLEEHGIPFTSVEITKTPPTIKELEEMAKFKDGQLKKLFNTSGLLYKEMGLSQKFETLTYDQALALLHQNGMLVKRPFLLSAELGLTGFNTKEWTEKLT